MAFCIEAERFVDDKLSNWYVRRSRRRFWKSEAGEDKLAAYQTLYAVLTTLTKLFAPVMPFLAEEMYRNLVVQGADQGPESVHLCEFPETDGSLIDGNLSEDMSALLRLVSLGSAARNSVKIKVRQPLAEMKVQPADERERRAVERFADQICEELNLKTVTLHDAAAGPLLKRDVKLNAKTAGPKFGPRLKEVQAALLEVDPNWVAQIVQDNMAFELPCPGGPVKLEPADIVVQNKAPEGWAGAVDRNTQVVVDARITEELAREGMARDVVRQVQDLRKQSGLEVEDRIVLRLDTESAPLQAAIEAHQAYIMAETLATQWATQSLDGEAHRTEVKVDGQPLTIELRRV
jgi:isoleucyl-tRNA synthetase